MRVLAAWLIAAMLCLGHGPARADDAASLSPADHRAIEQVISAQLEAFRRDAGETAFSTRQMGVCLLPRRMTVPLRVRS